MPDDPPPDEDAAKFFAFFTEVGIIAQLSRALLEARLPGGATVAQYSVLNHLVRVHDGRTPLELARAFQTPKNTMTHTLAGLETRGLIVFRPTPSDRRSKQVWITDAGRRFRSAAAGLLSTDIQRFRAKIDPDTVAALTPHLAEIRKILDEDRG
jgi:DNA-binding MarR family transcriptional regulator